MWKHTFVRSFRKEQGRFPFVSECYCSINWVFSLSSAWRLLFSHFFLIMYVRCLFVCLFLMWFLHGAYKVTLRRRVFSFIAVVCHNCGFSLWSFHWTIFLLSGESTFWRAASFRQHSGGMHVLESRDEVGPGDLFTSHVVLVFYLCRAAVPPACFTSFLGGSCYVVLCVCFFISLPFSFPSAW